MINYNIYLKLFGYRNIIDEPDNVNHEVILNKNQIEVTVNNNNLKWYQNKIPRLILNHLYPLIITLILMWIPIYTIIKAITNNNSKIFTSNILNILFLIQYILGLLYYKKNNIDKIFEDLPFNIKIVRILYIISITISILTTITLLLLLIFGKRIAIYSDLYNSYNMKQRVLLCILMFMEGFYTYNTLIINIFSFGIVFISHSIYISKFSEDLSIKIDNGETLEVNSISTDYQDIKYKYKLSIESWNNMFSSLTIFGLIGLYFIVTDYKTNMIGISQIINIIFITLADIVYLYVINKVNNSIDDIKDIISQPKFINSFRNLAHNEDITDVFSNVEDIVININKYKNIDVYKKDIAEINNEIRKAVEYIKNMTIRCLAKGYENSFSNEWQILNDQLAQEWASFSIAGFEINDLSLAKKAIGIFISFIAAAHINDQFFT